MEARASGALLPFGCVRFVFSEPPARRLLAKPVAEKHYPWGSGTGHVHGVDNADGR